jgi:hypothetical protein
MDRGFAPGRQFRSAQFRAYFIQIKLTTIGDKLTRLHCSERGKFDTQAKRRSRYFHPANLFAPENQTLSERRTPNHF